MSIKKDVLESYVNKLYEIGKVGNNFTLDLDTKVIYTHLNPDRAIFRVYELDKGFSYIVTKEFNDEKSPHKYLFPE